MSTPSRQPGPSAGADQTSLRRANLVARAAQPARPRAPVPSPAGRPSSGSTRPPSPAWSPSSPSAAWSATAGPSAAPSGARRPPSSSTAAGCAVSGAEINVHHVADPRPRPPRRRGERARSPSTPAGETPEVVLGRLAGLLGEHACATSAARGMAPVGVVVGAAGLIDRDQRQPDPRRPTSAGATSRSPTMLRDLLGDPAYPIEIDNEANLAAVAEATAGRPAPPRHPGHPRRGRRRWRHRRRRPAAARQPRVRRRVRSHHRRRPGPPVRLRAPRLLGDGRRPAPAARPGRRPRRPGPRPRPGARGDAGRAQPPRRRWATTRTLAALREVAYGLGVGAAHAGQRPQPGVIVLSGYFAEVGRWLREIVQARARRPACSPRTPAAPRVALSTLGLHRRRARRRHRRRRAGLRRPDVRRPAHARGARQTISE